MELRFTKYGGMHSKSMEDTECVYTQHIYIAVMHTALVPNETHSSSNTIDAQTYRRGIEGVGISPPCLLAKAGRNPGTPL